MPDELRDKHNSVLVKSKKKFYSLLKLKNKFPHLNKRLAILLLIILAIPVTIGLALIQQEIRSRASGGDRKIFLGMATDVSQRLFRQAPEGERLAMIQQDIERIKTETGSYPAVYHFFTELGTDTKIPSLEILNYLDSKGVTPMISLAPLGPEANRRDGRFIFSSDTTVPVSALPQGQLKFDSSNASVITKIYVSKTASGTESVETLVNTWIPGAKISVYGSKDNQTVDYDNSNHFDFTVNSKTDKGGYWEVGVTVNKPGTLDGVFANTKPVFITMADTLSKNWGNGQIANGSLDDRFTEFAQKAREFNKPIILRYAWEMDGTWFLWSAGKRDTLTSYSNYSRYKYFDMGNTTINYVSSWKHIYNLIKPIAPNVKFNWCSGGSPNAAYFPGDSYVDYVGFDAYSGINRENHINLINKFRGPINVLTTLSSKKIIIGETGINAIRKQITESEFSTYRKNWLREGYPALYNFSPKVAGIIYFNLDARYSESTNNWLMSYEPEISSAYRTLLLDPRFQGKFGEQASPPSPTPTPPDPAGCVRNDPTVTYGDIFKSGKRKETVIYKITIKNNDSSGCNERKVALDLNIPANLPLWTYSPKSVELAPNETKTVDFEVTSGKYASFGIKSLPLTLKGAYKPYKIFSPQTLQYNVVQ